MKQTQAATTNTRAGISNDLTANSVATTAPLLSSAEAAEIIHAPKTLPTYYALTALGSRLERIASLSPSNTTTSQAATNAATEKCLSPS